MSRGPCRTSSWSRGMSTYSLRSRLSLFSIRATSSAHSCRRASKSSLQDILSYYPIAPTKKILAAEPAPVVHNLRTTRSGVVYSRESRQAIKRVANPKSLVKTKSGEIPATAHSIVGGSASSSSEEDKDSDDDEDYNNDYDDDDEDSGNEDYDDIEAEEDSDGEVGVLDNLDMVPRKNTTLGINKFQAKMGDAQQHEESKVFTLFAKLPPELRHQIWKMASYESRLLSISGTHLDQEHAIMSLVFPIPPGYRQQNGSLVALYDDYKIDGHNVPAILHTNHEARHMGLKSYNIIFGGSREQQVYINYACDTLVVGQGDSVPYLIRNQQASQAPDLLERSLKFIAVKQLSSHAMANHLPSLRGLEILVFGAPSQGNMFESFIATKSSKTINPSGRAPVQLPCIDRPTPLLLCQKHQVYQEMMTVWWKNKQGQTYNGVPQIEKWNENDWDKYIKNRNAMDAA